MHLMPKRQAQIAGLSHATQWQDKMRYSSFFALGVGDGQILPPCKRKSSYGFLNSMLQDQMHKSHLKKSTNIKGLLRIQ